MKSRANKAVIVVLPVWQARVRVLSLFAAFMTLAAWVLYSRAMKNDCLLARRNTAHGNMLCAQLRRQYQKSSDVRSKRRVLSCQSIGRIARTRNACACSGALSNGSSPSRAVQSMKSRANQDLIVGLPVWQADVMVLLLFARFMTLAAWVLYSRAMKNICPRVRTEKLRTEILRTEISCARNFAACARQATMSGRNSDWFHAKRSTGLQVSKTRVPLAARIRPVPPPPALFNP